MTGALFLGACVCDKLLVNPKKSAAYSPAIKNSVVERREKYPTFRSTSVTNPLAGATALDATTTRLLGNSFPMTSPAQQQPTAKRSRDSVVRGIFLTHSSNST